VITSDSRYANAAHENPLNHYYDELGNVEIDDSTKLPTEVSRDATYLLTTGQGTPPPRHYMVKVTDNIQLLAFRSLTDPTQWWVVADANPHIRYPFDFVTGKTIHLPE
jgi:hypothetical protein